MLASVCIAVALLATFSTIRASQRDLALQKDRLEATAAVIASLSGEATANVDRPRAYAAIRSINAAPGVIYARVEDDQGRLIAETGSGARLTRDAQVEGGGQVSFLSMLRSRTIEVSAPVTLDRQRVGRVVLLGEVEGASDRLVTSLLQSLVAACLAALLGLAAAWRMQRGIAGPIQALTREIGQMRGARVYTQTVEVDADDETADLVEGFNALLSEVRARDEKIAQHMAGLERTVAERTADLQSAKEAADAASHAKSDFLATMSHEIRTPMNGIMVMAEMLAAGEMAPRQRRFAEVIAKSGSSLLAIINDILDFSKIEAGKLELEAAPVDPGEVVEDVCSLFWERARSKGLDLAACIAPDVPALVEADAVRLRQVVGNLVNNAIKFTETGGVLIEVTAPADGRLRVAVRDTGIGIPQDKIGDLFSAFSQADQSTTRRFGGTGLGLAICKRLVEAMGGQVVVRSTVGKGSVFAFEAPVPTLQAAEPPARTEGRVKVAVSGRFTRRAAERGFQQAGLTLCAEGEAPDLLLCEAGEVPVRSDKRCPVVCLAEYGESLPAQLQREGRVDALLVQPFRQRDLQAILSAWREGRPLGEAIAEEARAERDQLPRFEGARVLVVDDSAVNREVAMEALS
ncbi:MAG: ATP-binding protein, partial [Phenylobacterium sp.]